MKQLVRELYLGRLEGTKKLASIMERLKQCTWDPPADQGINPSPN
jgi:hypothetical protein